MVAALGARDRELEIRARKGRRMCTNPFCLGLYWCLEWDCCGKMDAEPEPKKLDRFAKPTSPTSM